jgi:hypothetical protein
MYQPESLDLGMSLFEEKKILALIRKQQGFS